MTMWVQNLLPVAADKDRPDVVIAGTIEDFQRITETYKHDPCQRLVRRESDGLYVLSLKIEEEEGEEGDHGTTMDTTIPKQCGEREKTKDYK